MNRLSNKRLAWLRVGLLLVVSLLTVTSVAALVHQHIGITDQGCLLCHMRHEPGMETPVVSAAPLSIHAEPLLLIAEIDAISRDCVPVRSGRAPPASF